MPTYHVRQGDSLANIADLLGVSLYELLAVNPQVANANAVIGGQEILVPEPPPVGRSGEPGPAVRREPPWLQMAKGEMARAIDEGPARNGTQRLDEYRRTTTAPEGGDDSPGVSAFVNWCIEKSGGAGTRSAAVQSWLDWGEALATPRRGCIAVLGRGGTPDHVGFYYEDDGGRVLVLGVGPGGRAGIHSYPKERLLGYRWPK